MDINTQRDLVRKADEARAHCYVPYSNYRVGCAILMNDGSVISGVNIENASYPVTLCAERSAMAHIISSGQQHNIKALAVVTKSSPPGSPCGMCRQFLSEFLASDLPIILGNESGEIKLTNMAELLPLAFKKEALV